MKGNRTKGLTSQMWRMMLGLMIITMIAFLIATLFFNERSRRDYEIQEADTLIDIVSNGVYSDMETYKDISRLVLLNEKVRQFLKQPVDAGITNDSRYAILDVISVCNNVDSVFIVRNNGQYMSTIRGDNSYQALFNSGKEWKQNIDVRRGGAVITMNGNGAVYRTNGMPLITIARSVYDIYSQKQTGIMMMNISTKMLDGAINLNPEGYKKICILSETGTYLAGNSEISQYFDSNYTNEAVYHREINNEYMISGKKMKDMPIVIMCKTKADNVPFPVDTMAVLLLLMIVFFFGMMVVSSFISKNIVRPIESLNGSIDRTQKSGWMEKLDVSMPRNELGVLADNYNSMIEYLNDLFNRLIEQEKMAQKAEMMVLQEQIKPHFLYNSLETISFMALDAGAEEVHSSLETLGSFYRNFLSKGDREIPFSREIRIIQDYLALQKLRYGDIINDEYIIDDNTLDVKIPKLILQPLVENCIYHGIRMKGEPGVIRVTAYLDDGVLKIKVYDDGVGMEEEVIEEILHGKKKENNQDNSGKIKDEETTKVNVSSFGLRGTIDRIRYYYDCYDVAYIYSKVGEYTEVELLLSINTEERSQ